jgi:Tfp pilus assembly protein PilE
MAELALVVLLIALILGVTIVVYQSSARKTELRASAEMLKQDIRKVYAKADAAIAVTGTLGQKYRDQYRVEFQTNAGSPPNCYRVMKRTYSGGAYGAWTLVAPEKSTSNKVIDNQWTSPCSGSTVISSAPTDITFVSKGSIIQTGAAGDVQIVLQEGSDASKTETITVSMFGSVE